MKHRFFSHWADYERRSKLAIDSHKLTETKFDTKTLPGYQWNGSTCDLLGEICGDRSMPIRVECLCGKRLRVAEKYAGRKVKCPGCQAPISIPRSATPEAEKKASSSSSAESTPEPVSSRRSASGRWNFLISFSWLMVGTAVALASGWLTFCPEWIENVGNLVPLVVTVVLVGWNLWTSLKIIGQTGHALSVLPLTLLQILLFTLLFFQIATHQDAAQYRWDGLPGVWDWLWFSSVHAIRAADLMDGIEAYGLDFQSIHSQGHLAAFSLVAYHLIVDLFFIRLLMEGVESWRRSLLGDSRSRWLLRLITYGSFAIFLVIWLSSALVWRPWLPWDLVLWPFDNLLRVVDFTDAMEIYHLQLHSVPKLKWEGTLTLICRVLMALLLTGVLGRLWQEASLRWLNGLGLRENELQDILETPRPESQKTLAQQRLNELRERRKRKADTSVQWVELWEVVTTVGVAGLTCLALLFVTDLTLPVQRLAETAIQNENESQAERALRRLERCGRMAEAALPLIMHHYEEIAPARRPRIVQVMGALGPSSTDALASILESGSIEEQLAAVEALGRIGHPFATEALLKAADSDVDTLGEKARSILAMIDEQYIPHLIDALTLGNAPVILNLLEQTDPYWEFRPSNNKHFPNLRAIREPLTVLQDAGLDESNRNAAIQVLRKNAPLSIHVVIHRLRSAEDDAQKRWATVLLNLDSQKLREFMNGRIIAALAELGEPAVEPLIEVLESQSEAFASELTNAFVKIGKPAIPALLERVSSPDQDPFPFIANVCVQIGEPALMHLVETREDLGADERVTINAVIVQFGPLAQDFYNRLAAEEPQELLEMFGSAKNEEGRAPMREALRAQGMLKALHDQGSKIVPLLITTATDRENPARDGAKELLIELGDIGVPMLIEHVPETDDDGRKVIQEVLVAIGAEISPMVASALRDSPLETQNILRKVLLEFGADGFSDLLGSLSGMNSVERETVVRLISTDPDRAISQLVTASSRGNGRTQGQIRALVREAGPDAVSWLMSRLFAADQREAGFSRSILPMFGKQVASQLVGEFLNQEYDRLRVVEDLLTELGHLAVPALLQAHSHSTSPEKEELERFLQKTPPLALGVVKHRSAPRALAFSPDGAWLATGGDDAQILIFHSPALDWVRTLQTNGVVRELAYGPDGRLLASADSQEVILWDVKTGEAVRKFPGDWRQLAFSPVSRFFATGDSDGKVKIWDSETGFDVPMNQAHTDEILDLAFSQDGNRLASLSDDETVKIWQTLSGALVVTLPLERSSANCVAFHPDGKRLAIGFYDSIEIYDTQTAIPTQTLRASQGDIERLAFRQDGSRLVSSAGRKNVADWDLQSGEVRYLNNVSPYLGGGFALSPNDKTIAVGQKDGEIVLADLDAEGPSAVTPLSDVVSPERVQFVRFSPDGQTVATFGYGEQPVTFWNALAGEALKTVPGKWEVFREVIWTANGLRIVGDMEKRSKLGVYDEDGHEVVQIPQGSGTYSEISPDRLSILVFENSAFLKEVRLDNGEAVTREEFIPPQVSRVSRGAEFTAGFENQKVTVWNCQSGKVVFSKSYKSGTLGAFSRFAAILAVRDQFGLDLVDLESPEELHRIEVPFSGELNSPIFSEYGRFVGDSSRRGLQIWDVQSRTEVISIPPSPDRKADFLTAPKFTTDETRVAIGTSDGVWVWDLESGKRLLGIQDSGPYVTDVEFSPDGTRLAVVSQRGAFIHFLGEPEIHQTP